jgi:Kelch motif
VSEDRPNSGSSLARRLPGFDARHATRRAKHTRSFAVVGVIALGAAALAAYLSGAIGATSRHQGSPSIPAKPATEQGNAGHAAAGARSATPTVSVSLMTTQLAAPISGEVVLPGTGTQLVIMGGTTTGGSTAPGVFTLDTDTGSLQHVGNLTGPLADAAGAVLEGRDVVLGGATPPPLSTSQGLPAPVPATGATTAAPQGPVPTASPLGALPNPRADSAVSSIGSKAYLVGGDDGTKADASVLATADGRAFSSVASLLTPVRFPAVAAVGRKLYVFGGEVASASGAWTPVDEIQMVDPFRHTARIVGHLPQALSQAAAVTLANQVFVVGGLSGVSPGASATIWWWDLLHKKLFPVGQLKEGVCRAGVALSGSSIWVVGGESNGAPVAAIQSLSVSMAHTR